MEFWASEARKDCKGRILAFDKTNSYTDETTYVAGTQAAAQKWL